MAEIRMREYLLRNNEVYYRCSGEAFYTIDRDVDSAVYSRVLLPMDGVAKTTNASVAKVHRTHTPKQI